MARPLAWMLSSLLVIGLPAPPSLAQSEVLEVERQTTRHVETRMVNAPLPEVVTGTRQLTGTTSRVEEIVTGPTTKLRKVWETRRYRTPVTTTPIQHEERRVVTVSSVDYVRRTKKVVPGAPTQVWMVGAEAQDGKHIRADLIPNHYSSLKGNYRNMAWPAMPASRTERSQKHYDEAKLLAVSVLPYDDAFLGAIMLFDKSTLAFIGGTMVCHGYKKANADMAAIPMASILRMGDHDAIQYRLTCANNEDWNPANNCGTGDVTWTIPLKGKLLEAQKRSTSKTEVIEEPFSEISEEEGPWTRTGRVLRGAGTVREEHDEETVLASQQQVVNGANATQALAPDGPQGRASFTGDMGSGGSRHVTLSGSSVRSALKADQARASRQVGKSHQAPASGPPKPPSKTESLR